jgi:branched-chain amino acid transport system ATP-binding protein
MSLDISNIVKNFGGMRVLDGVSLSVPDGSLFGLIGPNGAGKSTLFAAISGFQKQESGEVRLDGRRIDALSPQARARAGLVRTFQVPREFGHLTVHENLCAAAPGQTGESLLGLFFRPGRVLREEAEISARAEAVMERLRLEPFAGVNPVLIEEIATRIHNLNATGIGFLIIEHDLEALTRLTPHLAVLDRGRIIAEGSPNTVLADSQVREAYLGSSV